MIFEGRDNAWRTIYGYEDYSLDEWAKIREELLDNYKSVSKESYRTIEDCVKEDLDKETYFGFVHFFLEKTARNKMTYKEKFQNYVQEFQKAHPEWCLKKCSWILSDLGFQNPNVLLEKENDWKDFAKKEAELKSWDRNLEDIKENENVRIGELVPARKYELVQCAILLGLTTEQTNELLAYGDMAGLYPVNVIDSVCIFFLDYFAQHNEYADKETDELLEEQQSNLRKLKEYVNLYWEKFFYTERYDQILCNIDEKEQFKGFVFTNKLDEIIPQNLAEIRNKLVELENEEMVEKLIKKGDTSPSVTIFFENLQKKIWEKSSKEEQLQEFEKSFMSDEHLRMFTIYYYSYQEKILDFAKKTRRYQKNTYMSMEKLNYMSGKGELLEKPEWYINGNYANGIEMKMKTIQIIADIWKIDSLKYAGVISSNTRTAINHLLHGRNAVIRYSVDENWDEEDQDDWNVERKKQDKFYEAVLGKRSTIIKYALATGNEDSLDSILEVAGLRVPTEKSLEFVDVLINYALSYRDKLIDQWTKTVSDDEKDQKKKDMKSEFPMIKLILEMNRDLLFILEYKAGLYEAETRYIEERGKNHWSSKLFADIWSSVYNMQEEGIIKNPEIFTSILKIIVKDNGMQIDVQAPSLLFPIAVRERETVYVYKDNLEDRASYLLVEMLNDFKKSAKKGRVFDARTEQNEKIMIGNMIRLDLDEKQETLDMQFSKVLNTNSSIYIIVADDGEAYRIMKYFDKRTYAEGGLKKFKVEIWKITETVYRKLFNSRGEKVFE